MPKIENDFLPSDTGVRSGALHPKSRIAISFTNNYTKGANAKAHSGYLHQLAARGGPGYSWHYTVDSETILCHIPDDEIASLTLSIDNLTEETLHTIAVKICCDTQGDLVIACENAAGLTAFLMEKHGISLSGIDYTPLSAPMTSSTAAPDRQRFIESCRRVQTDREDSRAVCCGLHIGSRICAEGVCYPHSDGRGKGFEIKDLQSEIYNIDTTCRYPILVRDAGWFLPENVHPIL